MKSFKLTNYLLILLTKIKILKSESKEKKKKI